MESFTTLNWPQDGISDSDNNIYIFFVLNPKRTEASVHKCQRTRPRQTTFQSVFVKLNPRCHLLTLNGRTKPGNKTRNNTASGRVSTLWNALYSCMVLVKHSSHRFFVCRKCSWIGQKQMNAHLVWRETPPDSSLVQLRLGCIQSVFLRV